MQPPPVYKGRIRPGPVLEAFKALPNLLVREVQKIDKERQTMAVDTVRLMLALALLCCGAIASPVKAQDASTQSDFLSSNQTATLDCARGQAEIMGSNNVLTITGKCSGLELAGSRNKITIEFGASAQIEFVGASNTITWTSADGKPPKVSYIGSGNQMIPPLN
jgi:hypothetical protein